MEKNTLETSRLVIRAFAMEDFGALWEIFGDPAVMEHVAPYTEEEARDFLRTFCVERDPPGACGRRAYSGSTAWTGRAGGWTSTGTAFCGRTI